MFRRLTAADRRWLGQVLIGFAACVGFAISYGGRAWIVIPAYPVGAAYVYWRYRRLFGGEK